MRELPDFLDPNLFTRGLPYEAYRRLRDEEPASWQVSPTDGAGYWLLTRHADVHAASIDAAAFSSWRGSTSIHDEPDYRLQLVRLLLINMDPPSHTRYRRLITRAFAARAIEKLEPAIRALARDLLDGVAARGGECDFVGDVASPLPTNVILEFLGVPEQDRKLLFDLSNEMIDKAGSDEAMAASLRMFAYSDELTRARREHPGDDLVSHLIHAEIDGEKLGPGDINGFFLLLVVAGNETTRNLISGGLLALLDHPEELLRLRADRAALLPSAVEEMLRYVSPVMQFRRTVNRDIELHGRTLREGDRVIFAYASGNRDERAFPDPDRFDIARTPNHHLGFGVGPHLCIGAALARMEARVLFDELLARFEHIERGGEVVRQSSNFINGIRSLPLRLK